MKWLHQNTLFTLCQAGKCGNETDGTFCLTLGDPVPASTMETYSDMHEALFYACENSIGTYGTEMVDALTDMFETTTNITEVSRKACVEVAHCTGRRKKAKKRKSQKRSSRVEL